MTRFLGAVASALSGKKQASSSKPQVGFFSVVHGKRGSLEKLGTRAANTKCAGQCTCRCG